MCVKMADQADFCPKKSIVVGTGDVLTVFLYFSVFAIMEVFDHRNTYIHTHIHTYIHTYTHTYENIHTYIHTYIHTCIHTYIKLSWKVLEF